MKDLYDIIDECYTNLFKHANPSADYEKLKERNLIRRFPKEWFMNFYLNDDEQEKIIKNICEKHKLDKHDTQIVLNSIFMGHAPSGVKK